MRKHTSLAAAGLALTTWATAISAQAVPPVAPLPPSVGGTTPGAIQDTLKPPPKLEQIKPEAPVESAPKPGAKAGAGGKAIAVSRFDFSGNTLFETEVLRGLVSSYIGRSLTLFEIYEAADLVTAHYVKAGYTLASVNVPAQKIGEGVVRLEVIEGRVGKIQVEGNVQYRESHIQAYLAGVQPGDVYRGSALAEGLTSLNDLPGLSTRAVLRPGEEFGTSDIIVQAREDILSGSATIDNYGREDVGDFRLTLSGTVNNPLRAEDQLQVLGLVTEDHLLRYGYVSYNLPLNLRGTRLALSYGQARFGVNTLGALDGANKVGRVEVSHPFIRSRADRLSLSAGVSSTSADSDISGKRATADTDLTLFEVGANYLHAWTNRAATQLNVGLATNFDKVTDSAELQKTGLREDQRLRADFDLLHLQPLPKQMEALIHLGGAWSPDPLADTQKFSLGGPGNVRGYPASEVRGDKGYLASLTVRRPFTLGPVNLYGSVFADTGRVSSEDPLDPTDNIQTLSSVGIGLEGRYQKLNAKLDWSFPRDSHEASDGTDGNRLFGALSVSF